MTPTKPGILTTEFWLTILSVVLTVLLAGGYLSPTDVSEVQSPLTQMVKDVISVVVNGLLIRQYMAQRLQAKSVLVAEPPAGLEQHPIEDLAGK